MQHCVGLTHSDNDRPIWRDVAMRCRARRFKRDLIISLRSTTSVPNDSKSVAFCLSLCFCCYVSNIVLDCDVGSGKLSWTSRRANVETSPSKFVLCRFSFLSSVFFFGQAGSRLTRARIRQDQTTQQLNEVQDRELLLLLFKYFDIHRNTQRHWIDVRYWRRCWEINLRWQTTTLTTIRFIINIKNNNNNNMSSMRISMIETQTTTIMKSYCCRSCCMKRGKKSLNW